ncbi:DBH-like monooxygenase protein 2 homolog [Chanos chanos]|uniref:DBH-like monooxygenase protein 2 homolog n=1 Tax=Chanos chanos TaxID=29144 RepID=A0A6J2V5Z9_CHACN|nr:DBH-like monooxygenase protein 2 homolog [Chanos chanos]
MTSFLICSFLMLVLTPASSAQEDPRFPFSEYLDHGRDVRLRWGFDKATDIITFELTVNTSGWVGLGFSPNGGMAGSDIVIGGVGPQGTYFTDRYAEGNKLPSEDKQKNYELLSLTEVNGQTVMKFQRSITTCDPQDFTITGVPIKLIYAYGKDDNIGYHGSQRGTKEINLLNYMPSSTPSDSKYFDLTVTNYTVPKVRTTYHCKIMQAPSFSQKYHIYRVEPIIEHLDLVHHMVLYRCPFSVTKPHEELCFQSPEINQCFQITAAWGVGGGAFEFPEAAGVPIGGDGKVHMYRLEMHYDNPFKVEGRVDNSGLRFFYTSELRQHDAAVLQTGLAVSPGYAVPPNASMYHTFGYCDTSLIKEILPESGHDLQVFAAFLHTHLAGRKVRVGHYRDGKQIDFLAYDENYDFEYQQVVNLGTTKTIKQGDHVLVECTYNTQDRKAITWGGIETTDEMCLGFLYYYPAIDLGMCHSFPNPDDLMREMGVKDMNEWYVMMFSKTWDEKSIAEYEETVKKIPQIIAVVDSHNNASFNFAMIPELGPTPNTVVCDSQDMVRPATMMVTLLWLAVTLIM